MRHLMVDIGFICVHCGKKNVPPWNKTRYTTSNIIAETAICNFCEKEQKDYGTELGARFDNSNGLAREDGNGEADVKNLRVDRNKQKIKDCKEVVMWFSSYWKIILFWMFACPILIGFLVIWIIALCPNGKKYWKDVFCLNFCVRDTYPY